MSIEQINSLIEVEVLSERVCADESNKQARDQG
jgi:hypothetical protein